MLNPEKIVERFNRDMYRFYSTTTAQRDEIHKSFRYRDGWQHDTTPIERYRKRPLSVVNISAPMVRAVSGSEIMTASTIDYISTSPNHDRDADVISDVVDWCQYASAFYSERSKAAEDTATCGIGAYVTYMDTTAKDFIAGKPMCERVYPNFLTWDNSGRGGRLNAKAKWCGYAEPVDREWLEEYIEAESSKADGVSSFKEYLMTGQTVANYEHIEFLYHYFWYDFIDIYDVKNPFTEGSDAAIALAEDNTVANMFGDVMNELELDGKATVWILDKEEYKTLADAMYLIQVMKPKLEIGELEHSERKTKCYYRAEFGGGRLIKASKSYTTQSHALNFIEGYYDESENCYYGLMRPLSSVQDALNLTMSDFLEYARKSVVGGDAYIQGAEDEFERIVDSKLNEDPLTPLPENAKITPKDVGNAPEILINAIRLLVDLMPKALGLTQEFFGVITTGDMTDSLYGSMMKQSFAVLENFKNSSSFSDITQGYIWQDIVRMLAEVQDGLVIPAMSADHDQQTFVRLSKQSLARHYAIRVIEKPMTKDDKQDMFNKLITLAPSLMQAGINIYPQLLKLAPLDYSLREELLKVATPPPPQPDPLNIATIEANNAYVTAQAKKSEAEAARIMQQIELQPIEVDADVQAKDAKADRDKAETAKVITEIGNAAFAQVLPQAFINQP
jgi:hypothetical protein